MGGYGQEHLRHHGRDLPSPSISGGSRDDVEEIDAPHHGDCGPEIIPAEPFDHDCIGIRS